MESILKISDAAALAIHAIGLIARHKEDKPLKISELAKKLDASEAHLGKVMHRLTLAKLVASKRGPKGGFVLTPKAEKTSVLDLYQLFDGPRTSSNCLLGYKTCPFGKCLFGDAIQLANTHIKEILGKKKLSELTTA